MRTRSVLRILPFLLLLLLGCSRKEIPMEQPDGMIPSESRLVCSAQTLEEAQEVAGLYGIQLVYFQHGMAVFSTDEDPHQVIERGKAQGWPELRVDKTATIS